jgi:hypothetical protein
MEESIAEKYKRLRKNIKEGDLILFHGKKALAKTIQESDSDAYFNHIGVVGEMGKALFIIDSNANGVHPERLSERVLSYEDGDFIILRSEKSNYHIQKAFSKLMKRQEAIKIKYDFKNGFLALINRWFKTKFKTKIKSDRNICSMFVLPYALELEMVVPLEDMNNLFFPQDYIRQLNKSIVIE